MQYCGSHLIDIIYTNICNSLPVYHGITFQKTVLNAMRTSLFVVLETGQCIVFLETGVQAQLLSSVQLLTLHYVMEPPLLPFCLCAGNAGYEECQFCLTREWSDLTCRNLPWFFFFAARVHTTKSTVKILAANTHCKYFLKIAEVTRFFCTRNRLYQRFVQPS
jgi:hypothetical protein